jgi:hypothetical protein
MKKNKLQYFKYILIAVLFLLAVGLTFLVKEDGGIRYGENPEKMNWENEGPYIFFEDSIMSVNYIKGNQEDGFNVQREEHALTDKLKLTSYFNLDNSAFSFNVDPENIKSPKTSYTDGNKIFAVADIESGFKAFRDLLKNNEVIDEKLNWSFGNGHLVLVGDFIDKGFSATQILWFIYKLEQEAIAQGGVVHFIIGNHELKNFQGNFDSASPKYLNVASILGKQQQELYNKKSFIGKWMASKNAVELINGHLFAHGGIHPDVAKSKMDLDEINKYIRKRYYEVYSPKKGKSKKQIFVSTKEGPVWYRGYFKDKKLTQKEVEKGLKKFKAVDVIVGHTVQSKVNRSFEGKVIGINVVHPKDYHKNWPKRKSEALLIQGIEYYRVLHNGKRVKI